VHAENKWCGGGHLLRVERGDDHELDAVELRPECGRLTETHDQRAVEIAGARPA
jgi:hypothetical protein